MNVPPSTSAVVSRSHSSSEPSHHSTRSGLVSAAMSRTHPTSLACRVGASAKPGMSGAAAIKGLLGSGASLSVCGTCPAAQVGIGTSAACEKYNKRSVSRSDALLRGGTTLPHLLHLLQRRAQLRQPLLAVLAHEANAPGQRMRPRPG